VQAALVNEYRRCTQRLISDESGRTSGSQMAQGRLRGQRNDGRRAHRLEVDVEGLGQDRRRRYQRRGAGQSKCARCARRRGVITSVVMHARQLHGADGVRRSERGTQLQVRMTAGDADHESHRYGRMQCKGAQRQQREPAPASRLIQAGKKQELNPRSTEPLDPE